MKNFKTLMGVIVLFALLFTSCSKDETPVTASDEVAVLTLGASLSDFDGTNKQAIPVCTGEDPAYAMISFSYGDVIQEDVKVAILEDENGWFTAYEDKLEIPVTSGNTVEVTLHDFVIYGANDMPIWVAPKAGSDYAAFVNQPTGEDFVITLRAGSKNYTDVEVLCYDEREVNRYGYQFFDIHTTELIEFCIFGNYCNEAGRHFAAQYSVDVWAYADGQKGDVIYEDYENVVEENAANSLCVSLPDREGMDEYYFEITLMDGEDYDVTERVVRAGVISDEEIRMLFDGDNNVESYHFGAGCEGQDNIPIFQDPEDDAMFYKSRLTELNESGVFGLAYLRLEGQVLETTIWAAGLTPDMIHPQHIHGLDDDQNATCPDASDAGDDGILTLGEGAPYYGPVILPLMQENGTWPVANTYGMYVYERTFNLPYDVSAEKTVTVEDLMPLVNRAIVLHGMFVPDGALSNDNDEDPNNDNDADTDPDYIATLPVACGQIWEINE